MNIYNNQTRLPFVMGLFSMICLASIVAFSGCTDTSNGCDTPEGTSYWDVTFSFETDDCCPELGGLTGKNIAGEMEIFYGSCGADIVFESYSNQTTGLTLDFRNVPLYEKCIDGEDLPGHACSFNGFFAFEIDIHGNDLTGWISFSENNDQCYLYGTMTGTGI